MQVALAAGLSGSRPGRSVSPTCPDVVGSRRPLSGVSGIHLSPRQRTTRRRAAELHGGTSAAGIVWTAAPSGPRDPTSCWETKPRGGGCRPDARSRTSAPGTGETY
jgi:hypothetical protein